MFSVSFQTAAIAIAQIFAMGAVGYALVRKGFIDENGLKLLSFLSVNVLFPLFIFYQILHNFDPAAMPFWWGYPLINIALVMTGLAVTMLAFFLGRRHMPPDEFLAVSSLHNAGYIPLLMAMALPLGEVAGKVYTAVIISIIGFDTCLWSLGVWLITRRQAGPHMDLKKMLNPPLLSMAAAVLIVLVTKHGLPYDYLLKPVKIMGDSALAVAMLVIGGNLAMTRLANVRLRHISGVLLIKLMALPLLALCALIALHLDPVMSLVVMIQACMPTSVTLSIIGRHYGTKNQDFINQSIFYTHLLSVLTVPVFLALYGKWGN